MKKYIKGFTLIELIIVMAILSILMLGLMQMMKPIRATFVDSTYYELQRNTQNGMATYIGESIRYATKLGIYNEQHASVNSLNDAVTRFKSVTKYDASKDGDINVITIDNSTAYIYNGETCYGRIVRSKDLSAGTSRLALGDAYYGKYTYSISVEPTGVSEQHSNNLNPSAVTGIKFSGVKITVSSLLPSALKKARSAGDANNTGSLSGYDCVSTEGETICRNLSEPVNGISDAFWAVTGVKPSGEYEFNTTAKGKKTYIVFTLPKE